MKKNQILEATIKNVKLHREERKIQGALFGTYTSNYVAEFEEYPNGIAVIDNLATNTHPDWQKKTHGRASTLAHELIGKCFQVIVKDVFDGDDCFECKEL